MTHSNEKSSQKPPEQTSAAKNSGKRYLIGEKGNRYLIRRPRRSIRMDRIQPSEFMRYIYGSEHGSRFPTGVFCEDCSHFAPSTDKCMMGYKPVHKRTDQLRNYELSGEVAFCRSIEID